MMSLAPALGRDQAHEVVYRACELARSNRMSLQEATRLVASEAGYDEILPKEAKLVPEAYLGEASQVVDYAIGAWRSRERHVRGVC